MRSRRRRREPSLFDITPMIDVVFLLNIFFMATAQYSRMTRSAIELPREAGERRPPEEAGFVINITAGGEIEVVGRRVDLTELERVIRAEMVASGEPPEQFKLLLRADRNAAAAQLNRIVETLSTLGLSGARLATEVPR